MRIIFQATNKRLNNVDKTNLSIEVVLTNPTLKWTQPDHIFIIFIQHLHRFSLGVILRM